MLWSERTCVPSSAVYCCASSKYMYTKEFRLEIASHPWQKFAVSVFFLERKQVEIFNPQTSQLHFGLVHVCWPDLKEMYICIQIHIYHMYMYMWSSGVNLWEKVYYSREKYLSTCMECQIQQNSNVTHTLELAMFTDVPESIPEYNVHSLECSQEHSWLYNIHSW